MAPQRNPTGAPRIQARRRACPARVAFPVLGIFRCSFEISLQTFQGRGSCRTITYLHLRSGGPHPWWAARGARVDFVRILMRNVTSLHHLLDDVTGLARLQAGREQRQIEPLDVSPILQRLPYANSSP